jgi:hypothetical protein
MFAFRLPPLKVSEIIKQYLNSKRDSAFGESMTKDGQIVTFLVIIPRSEETCILKLSTVTLDYKLHMY